MKILVKRGESGNEVANAQEAFRELLSGAEDASVVFLDSLEYGGWWDFASIDFPGATFPPADWRAASWWWPVPPSLSSRRSLLIADVIQSPRYKSMIDAAEASLKANVGAVVDVIGMSPSGPVRVTLVPRFSECTDDKDCPVTKGYTAKWWLKLARSVRPAAPIPWGGSDTRL
jgi:hypothetical protein